MSSKDRAGAGAIADATHSDPFSFLGMHAGGKGEGFVVRAFFPEADGVEIIDSAAGKRVSKMRRVHKEGVFVSHIKGRRERFPYHYRVQHGENLEEAGDPYRFPPAFGELDAHLMAEGTHFESYKRLGAHPWTLEGVDGVCFGVWAPGASRVSVVGSFNRWDGRRHPMRLHPSCGVWEIFIPGIPKGTLYKFEIKAGDGRLLPLKSDPYAFRCERAPRSACIVEGFGSYQWRGAEWMANRHQANRHDAPMAIYEVHMGSWRRCPEEGERFLTYREMADQLVPYVKDMGFTHIELMPINEFPFDGSWGYQPIGLFAPTSRFGAPDDFRAFIDCCHEAGISVILDWVPGHFPEDEHGLAEFDGTHLYEHSDPRQGRHMDWGTLIYNYGRAEVANFLLSNALFWLERYHIDGLRVDAVASMLYLDYSREDGQWIPNAHGGNENLEAITFLKRMNELVYERHPGAFMVAEESTAWPMVSRPTYLGGLGFGYKWNLGWMHDTLRFISKDPAHRQYHQDDITFGLLYAFHENFILPLSHDEVVHGKGSILGRMPGDKWRRFASLRAYYGFMYAHPGKKLMFMGCEFGQEREWAHDESLDWHLLEDKQHKGVQNLMRDLNHLYRNAPALHQRDFDHEGFAWIDCHDHANSVLSFMRRGNDPEDLMVIVCNFTPVVREGYRVGVPSAGFYKECLNTDSSLYGGSNVGNLSGLAAEAEPMHGHPHSLYLTLPPLATLMLRPAGGPAPMSAK
ncbi:MAG TPA: 1,4-alpha-glucan branching protein GlgB, partial [Rhodospirillales bacterium]|nr:1,4-alpha-glucan branching protein GlgB [Rhodospirillales bacterium]